MKFNLKMECTKGVSSESYKITFNQVCFLIENNIDRLGYSFIITPLGEGYKQRVINDRIDYAEFVDEFGGEL